MNPFSRLLCLCLVAAGVQAETVKKYTAPFAQYGDIYEADASLWANISTRQHVNSEGSEIQTSQVLYRLFIYAFTKADDGMELPRYESFSAFAPEGLPSDDEVLALVERNSAPFFRGRGDEVLVSIVTPRLVLFEDITLKPPSGEIPKVPVSIHPYFDK